MECDAQLIIVLLIFPCNLASNVVILFNIFGLLRDVGTVLALFFLAMKTR